MYEGGLSGRFGLAAHLILGCISNQPLSVCESNIAGCGSISHIICDDLHSVILPDANAAVLHVESANMLAGHLLKVWHPLLIGRGSLAEGLAARTDRYFIVQ